MKHVFLLLFILFLISSTYLLVLVNPLIGLLLAAGSVLLFLLLAVRNAYDLYAGDLLSLMTTFPLLLISVFVIHITIPFLNAYCVYLLLLLLDVMYIFRQFVKNAIFSFGKSKTIAEVGFFVLFFASLITIAGFESLVRNGLSMLAVGIAIILIASAEELFFRFLLQNAAIALTEEWLGIIFIGILYVLFHATMNTSLLIGFAVFSIVSSVLYKRTNNVYFSILLNIVVNLVFYLVTGKLLTLAA